MRLFFSIKQQMDLLLVFRSANGSAILSSMKHEDPQEFIDHAERLLGRCERLLENKPALDFAEG